MEITKPIDLFGIPTVRTNFVWYTLVVQRISDWDIDESRKLWINFLWNGDKYHVKHETVILRKVMGGLNAHVIWSTRYAFGLKSLAKYISVKGSTLSKFMSYKLAKYKHLKLTDEILYMSRRNQKITRIVSRIINSLWADTSRYHCIDIIPMARCDSKPPHPTIFDLEYIDR